MRCVRIKNLGLTITLLLLASSVSADEIQVGETVVQGTVTAVSASGVEVQPELGKGTVTFLYEDIQRLESDAPFWVLHGDEGESTGRLLGVEDGMLLVGNDRDSAERIELASIFTGSAVDGGVSEWERLRARWRFWSAALDAGFSFTDSTTDTSNASVGFLSERRKSGTRIVLKAGYLFGTEKEQGESRSTLNNEVTGLIRGEYDLSKRIFVLAGVDAEYDEIERLSIRTVPKAGLGWHVYKTKTSFFNLETAPAYNYERFFGGDTNESFGISFGAEAETVLPYDAVLGGRVDYLPAVDDWANDYLIRSEVGLSVPIIGMLAFRASLAEQYDNTPAPGNQRNELQTAVGLSLRL